MNNTLIVGATAALSLAAGAISGYFFARHRLEQEYAQQLRDELASTKAFYSKMYKTDEFETPEQAVETLIPDQAVAAMLQYQGNIPKQVTDYRTVRNVFEEKTTSEIDEEIANRTEEAPYIISVTEYSESGLGYQQNTLTYYILDGVLADEKEENIPDIDEAVGDNNIHRFGHRSNDPNVLYVRNDALEIDFEIIQKNESYKKSVLGLD